MSQTDVIARPRPVEAIGVSAGRGGGDPRSGLGPSKLAEAGMLSWLARGPDAPRWREIKPSGGAATALDEVHEIASRLAASSAGALARGAALVVVGGDHSCAIGTWSGAANALAARGPVGLVWIDAHMDSHTPETTPSGRPHGMPVAHLLGHGDPRLTGLAARGPALRAEHLALVGVRSHEPAEPALLGRLGVAVHAMDEVARRGLATALGDARRRAATGTAGWGVSLDLDAIDPEDAPAVGSPEPGGIRAAALLEALRGLARDPAFLGIEIAEFNPALDHGDRTVRLIRDVLEAVFAD